MGTLSPPFILCPMSDRKELLGMSEDRLQNKVIITIGKNIAIRYHILEQKQETSWTISRHWLTSRVVYCSEVEKYGAVIDNNILALWDESDTGLHHFKKYKFTESIFELRPTRTLGTLVIFENGYVMSLNKATATKTRCIAETNGLVDKDSEVIIDVDVNEVDDQVVIIVGPKLKNPQKQRHIQIRESLKVITIQLPVGQSLDTAGGNEIISQLDISQDNLDIIGYCNVITEEKSLVYVCSDGKVYQQPLTSGSTSSSKTLLGYLGKYVSVKTPVVIKYIPEGSMFVIYASDSSEEGAVVFLYDLKYDLVVAKQSLKLYGTPPIMEKIGSSVIVPVGLHILVLGFRASKSLLSTVVGKHQIRSGEEVFEQRNPWDGVPSEWEVDKDVVVIPKATIIRMKQKAEKEAKKELTLIKQQFPDIWEIVHQFKILEREGQPESLICSQVVPLALELNNIAALDWILDTFTDIPENFLVSVLHNLLGTLKPPSVIKKKDPKENTRNESMDIEVESEVTYLPNPRINRLLARSFDKQELIRCLPALDYEIVRKFVIYLKSMMQLIWPLISDSSPTTVENVEGDGDPKSWMKWISAVFDAHYTKFVFNNEIGLIEEILAVLSEKTKLMEAIEELEPYLLLTYNKVKFEPRPNPNSKWRTETIIFS